MLLPAKLPGSPPLGGSQLRKLGVATAWVKVEGSNILSKGHCQMLCSVCSAQFEMVHRNKIIPHMQRWKVHRERPQGVGQSNVLSLSARMFTMNPFLARKAEKVPNS